MRKFFWLVIFLFVFVVSHAAAIEITQVGKVVAPHPNTNQEFLILISDNFWQVPEVQKAISQWQEDLFQHVQVGSRVFAVTPCFTDNYYGTGGDLESSKQIRNFLSQQYWEKGIIGAVFIGDISFIPMWYRPYIDGWSSSGPCEIFFADLDYDFSSRLKWEASWKYPDKGTWYFNFDPEDGFSSYDGSPEIWVSRIIPPVREILKKLENGKLRYCVPSFKERVRMLLRFFEKDHEYWQGNEYCDLAYFIQKKIEGCNDYYWPIFPENWVKKRSWCSNCNSKDDYFNLPGTKLVYFSSHGGTYSIDMCPESSDPDDVSLGFLDVFYYNSALNIVISDSCNTFDFSKGKTSIGQMFLFGESSVVSGIGLGVAGCVGKFDSRPYSSILPFGEIWKGVSSWIGSWNGIEFILMGDPFVWVAKRIDVGNKPYYFEYGVFDSTYFACGAAIKPLTLRVEDDILSLNFQWPGSINPVDIYIGVDARNSMGYFFFWTADGRIVCWDGNLSSLLPYKKEWVRGAHNKLFSGSLNNLPLGDYDGWVLVVPSGTDMSNFSFENSRYLLYHWHWVH